MTKETSKIIPNSYQTPNFLVDVIMRLLTGNEQKCVDVICRKTFGWQKRSDRISKSQLIGFTGIGSQSVDRCMAELVKYRVVIRVAESIHNLGVEWSIQTDDGLIDLTGLRERDVNRRKINSQRASKARSKNKVGMSDNPTMSDIPPGGLSDIPHKSHYQKKNSSSSSATGEKIILFFRQEIGKVTPTIKEELMNAKTIYSEEWVLEALAEAVHYNKRSWAYAETILKRWKAEGFKTKKKGASNATSNKRSERVSKLATNYTDQDREAARHIVERNGTKTKRM